MSPAKRKILDAQSILKFDAIVSERVYCLDVPGS